MTQYGGGTGIPVSGSNGTIGPSACKPAISLARYATLIGYRESAFFGVDDPNNVAYACRAIWTKDQRDMIEYALNEAQIELENEIGYHLAPCWEVNEQVDYGRVMRLHWGNVISAGIVSDTILTVATSVNHATNPAIVGPIALGGCNAENMRLFHAGTNQEIEPESYSEIGGNITFTIPWCRLVSPAYADNPPEGLSLGDVDTWISHAVDVRCISNDTSVQASLIYRYGDSCQTPGCTEHTHTACVYVRNARLGHIDVTRADYSGGLWTVVNPCCQARPDWVYVNYLSGLQTLMTQAEDAIVRLAHSKMAEEPCGCDVTQRLWARDRNVPQVLTRERINCPFGLSDGAWWAYRQAQTMRLGRAGVI